MPPRKKPVTGRARPRKQRDKMAGVRAFWTFVFPGIGFALTYVADIDRLREFGIAIPVAIALGAALYAAKRYWWPDTEF